MDVLITTALPLFALIAAGYIIGTKNIFPAEGAKGVVFFVWYLAMPALIFKVMSKSGLPTAEDGVMLSAFIIPMIITFLIAVFIVGSLFKQDFTERAMYGYSVCFGNKAYMGLPLTFAAFGEAGLRINVVILSVHEIFLIIMCVLIMQIDKKDGGNIFKSLGNALVSLLTNPVIVSIIVSFVAAATKFQTPAPIMTFVDTLAPAAAPAGLFALGASLAGVKNSGDQIQSLAAAAMKLLLLPLLVFIAATFAELPTLTAMTMVLLASLPTGLNAFNYAMAMGVGYRRAASTILYSTLASLVTVSVLLLWINP